MSGIIVADQLPSTVAPEVVRNTGTKLAHRLVSNEDREDLGGAMLLGETEIEEIARLSPGEAYLYTEGLHRPRRVRCLHTNKYLDLDDPPDDESIRDCIQNEEWFFENRPKDASELAATLRATLDEARKAVRRHAELVPDLANRIEETCRINSRERGNTYNKQCRLLRSEAIPVRHLLEEVLRKSDARFHLADAVGPLNNNTLEAIIAHPIAEWRDRVRPRLFELVQESRALESRVPSEQSARIETEMKHDD